MCRFSLSIYHLQLLVFVSILSLGPLVRLVDSFSVITPTLFKTTSSSTSFTELYSLLEDNPTRREAIENGAAAALSTLLVWGNFPRPVIGLDGNDDETTPAKTILMTGGNSGIGFEAAKKLAAQGHTLILPCRTMDKSIETIEKLEELSFPGKLIAAECDLTSLKSIKNFATQNLPSLLSNNKLLDTVCLNAGIARNTDAKDVARTVDGFELTVGTNHLGHFYLNQLLLPLIQPNGGKIVVTASGVHDPKSPGGAQGEKATLGNLEGFIRDGKNFEMVDGQPFNADKAYKDSKLCNVFFTRELQRRLDSDASTKRITVNCFNPGLIVSTGLFRDQNPVFTKLFDIAATDLFKVGETPEWGGGCLAYMTNLDQNARGLYYTSPPGSSKYGNSAYGDQFQITMVSEEAQDDEKAKRLWELSEQLLASAE